MSPSCASLSHIAREIGVSPNSVSAALRGKKGVSDQLRQRILACAQQRGYHPNPIASELMSLVRSGKRMHKTGNTIAFINPFSDPSIMNRRDYRLFYEGAERCANKFGYDMEVFVSSSPGMSGPRLTQILHARGIRGVLVGARLYDDPEVCIDWSKFSAVLIGEAKYRQNLFRVCNDHTQTCLVSLQKLYSKGYRRICVALMSKYEESRGHGYTLGIDCFSRDTSTRNVASLYLYEKWDPEAFRSWCDAQDVDAVLALEPEPLETVQGWNDEGAGIGLAALSLIPGSKWSGINQHSVEVGATAMEFLRNLLLGGARGTDPRPKVILVEGEWQEGNSTQGKVSPHCRVDSGVLV